jgi:hypothetical protein
MWGRQTSSLPWSLVLMLVIAAVGASATQSTTPTPTAQQSGSTEKSTPIVIDN